MDPFVCEFLERLPNEVGPRRFAKRTIFVSNSRDMRLGGDAVQTIRAVVEAINSELPEGDRFQIYHYSLDLDANNPQSGYQQQLPRSSDPKAYTICLLGERVGEPLRGDFEVPLDLSLPEWVTHPHNMIARETVPLTGTVFELLDALFGPNSGQKPRLLVYQKGDADLLRKVNVGERRYGFAHYHSLLVGDSQTELSDLEEENYRLQRHWLHTLTRQLFEGQSSQHSARPYRTFGKISDTSPSESLRDLKSKLERDLRILLGLKPKSFKKYGKGLHAYDLEDADFIYGRDSEILCILEKFAELEDANSPPVVYLTGRNGEGKSSLFRAGVAGRLHQGWYSNFGRFSSKILEPHMATATDPLEWLVKEFAQFLGPSFDPSRLFRFAKEYQAEEFVLAIELHLKSIDEDQKLLIVIDQIDNLYVPFVMAPFLEGLISVLSMISKRGVAWIGLPIPDHIFPQFTSHFPELGHIQVQLKSPGEEQLRAIVIHSLSAFGMSIDLVKRESIEIAKEASEWMTGSENPGPILPLLSVLITEFQKQVSREQMEFHKNEMQFDENTVERNFTLRDTIEVVAERLWRDRPTISEEQKRHILNRLFDALIKTQTVDGIDYQVSLQSLDLAIAKLGGLEIHAQNLVRSRLAFQPTDTTTRLTHAVVVDAWSYAREWFEGNRDRLISIIEFNALRSVLRQEISASSYNAVLPDEKFERLLKTHKLSRCKPEQLDPDLLHLNIRARVAKDTPDWWLLENGDSWILDVAGIEDAAARGMVVDRLWQETSGRLSEIAWSVIDGFQLIWLLIAEPYGQITETLLFGAYAAHNDPLHKSLFPKTVFNIVENSPNRSQNLLKFIQDSDLRKNTGSSEWIMPSHLDWDFSTHSNIAPSDFVKHKKAPQSLRLNAYSSFFLHACSLGNLEFCIALDSICRDCVVSAAHQGYSSLVYALQSSSRELAKWIIDRAPNLISNLEPDGTTSLHRAVYCRDVEAVLDILKLRPDLASVCANDGSFPAYAAASNGDLEIIKLLVEHDPGSITLRYGEFGSTAVTVAASQGQSEVLEYLLDQINQVDLLIRTDHRTALSNALQEEHFAIADLLVHKFPELLRHRTEIGSSIYTIAGAVGNLLAIQWCLETVHTNDDWQRPDGHNALHNALANGHFEAAKLIHAHFPDFILSSNCNGNCALHDATRAQREDIFLWVIETAPSLIDATRDLMALPWNQAWLLPLKTFIDEIPNFLTTRNNRGSNIFTLAAVDGHLEVVQELLRHSIDPNDWRRPDGHTAIANAISYDHLEVAQLLHTKVPGLMQEFDGSAAAVLLTATQKTQSKETMSWLLEAAPSLFVDFHLDSDYLPIHKAAIAGDREKIKKLCAERINNLKVLAKDGNPPIALALESGELEAIRLFYQLDATTLAQFRDIQPIAALAIVQDNAEALNWICDISGGQFLKPEYQLVALAKAFHAKSCLELLANQGLEISSSETSMAAFDLLILLDFIEFDKSIFSLEVFSRLLRWSGSRLVEICDESGFSPLHLCAIFGRFDVVLEFPVLTKNIDLAPAGFTALTIALILERSQLTDWLLSNGADLDFARSCKPTVLSSKTFFDYLLIGNEKGHQATDYDILASSLASAGLTDLSELKSAIADRATELQIDVSFTTEKLLSHSG